MCRFTEASAAFLEGRMDVVHTWLPPRPVALSMLLYPGVLALFAHTLVIIWLMYVAFKKNKGSDQ